MIKALDFMQDIIHITYTAYTLQLVVGKGLLEIENLVKHAKKLMLYFTTPKQTQRLLEAQKKFNCNENINLSQNDHKLHIIADVPTRWNSSYLAWQRLIKIRNIIDPMITMLFLNKDTRKEAIQLKKINLTETNAIKAIFNSLIMFDDFELQQVNYNNDESAFNDNDQTNDVPYDCTNIGKRVRIALYNAINYYWQVLSEEGMLAALLDP
ncbi:hypothetical protein C2G38_2176183 [Gigaspora rosea]|uniref:Uncharacterized protein n=1 Tax=Gigaspora rosea TaxID=44941 RepID=A0A397VNW1_9GLOM|nr:hypothetical protein C2G38_2176183 [Gigaspora rosea]